MTVVHVMGKTEYNDKMDALVNDKQTYEELEIQPLHCNSHLTTNYSNLHYENKALTLSDFAKQIEIKYQLEKL